MKDTTLIFNHPNFEKIEENIWVIHNFLLENECKEYTQVAETAKEEEWWKENNGWYKGKFLSIQDMPVIQTSFKISDRFAKLFEYAKEYSFGGPGSIHRMLPGEEMFVHADFAEIDNVKEDYVLFNAAVYHNEFDGGELFYPELGIEYKPKSGDLVMHPGTTKYRHGVKKVLGDQTRYMSNTWVADKIGIKFKISGG